MTTAEGATPLADQFWSAWQSGRLLLQHCNACGAYQFYPRLLCVWCGTPSPKWVDAAGVGEIYSFTIVRRPPSQAFAARVPYAIALVTLDEGPRIMAHIQTDELEALACGARVEVLRPPVSPDALVFKLQ